MDPADLCATCGAPMASDQRYCLECGSRRSTIGSGSLAGSHISEPGSAEEGRGESTDRAAPAQTPGGVDPRATDPVVATAPVAVTPRNGGPTAIIAGVGVLLLSMGVGVLIGRAGSGSSGNASTGPAQVISVASPGAAGATTPTTSTPTSTGPAKTSSHKASKAPSSSASGVGQVPSKPAPPTVLEHLRTGGSGQSYEQRSKNLPNVVSTG
jgi:hypothetical protein